MLCLPRELQAIHPVFHVSQLESIEPNTILNRVQEPPPPVEVEGEEHYEVGDILDSKIDKRYHFRLPPDHTTLGWTHEWDKPP